MDYIFIHSDSFYMIVLLEVVIIAYLPYLSFEYSWK